MKIHPVGAKLFHGDRHYKPKLHLQFYKPAHNPTPNVTSCPPLQTACDQIKPAQMVLHFTIRYLTWIIGHINTRP